MKGITDNVEGLEFGVADGEARRIRLAVLDGGDVQSFLGGRMRDQLNDGFQRGKWYGAPVDGDKRKEAMLDLVPFAGGRRIMRHGDRELFFSGQGLQGLLPQRVAHPEAFAPIGGDEEFVCLGIEPFSPVLPTPPDALYRQLPPLIIS